MKIRYRSDLYGNYVLAEIPEDANINQYAFKMLLRNKIPGVLPCKERMEDGKSYLYMDISQKRSLLQEYQEKEMQLEDMVLLFQEITQILEEARTYLLHENMVNLNPEYIFRDLEEQHLYVLILPWVAKEKTIHKLAEFFLEKINHRDENGVNAAYHFYRQQSQSQFFLSQFIPILERESILKRQKRKNETEAVVISEDTCKEIESRHDTNEVRKMDFYTEEEKRTTYKEKKGILKSGKIGLFLLSAVFFILGFLPIINSTLKLSCLSFAVLLPTFFLVIGTKKEKEPSMESFPVKEIEIDRNETVFFNSYEDEERLKLEWKERGRRKQYVLKDLPCTVGKIKEEVSLVIADISVSRVHCKFIEKDKKICLMDLNSTNGTFLNGLPMKNGEIQEIEKNDEILIGKVKISVV